MTEKELFEVIQKEIIKGTLQERLGYDLYGQVFNYTWETLPSDKKEQFREFIKREKSILISAT